MQRKACLGLLAVVLPACLALVAAGSAVAASGSASARAKTQVANISIGGNPSVLYTPAYVAQEMGFFAKQGIKASFPVVANTPPALIGGSIQFALNGADGAFLTAGAGNPTPITVVLQQHNSLSLIVQSKYAAAAKMPWPLDVRALPKGFTVGTTVRGGGGEVFLDSVLNEAGLKEGSDYSVVTLGTGQNMAAAMAAGRVDATLAYAPFDGIMTASGGGGTYMVQESKAQGPSDIYQGYGAALLATPSYVKSHAAVAKGLVTAIVAAEQWMHQKKNLAKMVTIASKYTGVTDTAAIKSVLPYVINLASPGVTCNRLSQEGKLNIKVGTTSALPSCDDLRFASLVPNITIKPLK